MKFLNVQFKILTCINHRQQPCSKSSAQSIRSATAFIPSKIAWNAPSARNVQTLSTLNLQQPLHRKSLLLVRKHAPRTAVLQHKFKYILPSRRTNLSIFRQSGLASDLHRGMCSTPPGPRVHLLAAASTRHTHSHYVWNFYSI